MAQASFEILLIEDNPGDIRFALESFRESRLQNTLQVVTDGEQALQYLRRQGRFEDATRPGLILLDIHLPRIDGLEILEEMQLSEDLKGIPVAILTTSALDEQLLKQRNLPTDCFIRKPVTVERYVDAIRCFPELGLKIVQVGK